MSHGMGSEKLIRNHHAENNFEGSISNFEHNTMPEDGPSPLPSSGPVYGTEIRVHNRIYSKRLRHHEALSTGRHLTPQYLLPNKQLRSINL